MKLGKHFEGTSEELKDLCENYGFEPSAFLSKAKQHNVHWGYIMAFAVGFFLVSLIIWIVPMNADLKKSLIVLDFILIIVNTITVHLKFERWEVTTVTLIGSALVMGLCLNILTPEQVLDELKEKNPMEKNE